MEQVDDDFYQSLRQKIRAWLDDKGKTHAYAGILLLGPDLLHLLCKLTVDRRVPVAHKAALAGAIAYFLSPFDLIPEALLGPIGFIDDIALAAYVLHRFVNAGHGKIAEEHWAGDGSLLQVLQRILEIADATIVARLWRRIKGLAGR
jgi:uncharacterized membrane protein YkvA (DUF1232 family)